MSTKAFSPCGHGSWLALEATRTLRHRFACACLALLKLALKSRKISTVGALGVT